MIDCYYVYVDVLGNSMTLREFAIRFWRRTHGDGGIWIGDMEDFHAIDGATVEYEPWVDPCRVRFCGIVYDRCPYRALLQESKRWPDLVFRWRVFDTAGSLEGYDPECYRFENGKAEVVEQSNFLGYYRSANPKHTPIHHWEISLTVPSEYNDSEAIQQRLREDRIFLSTKPGKELADFGDPDYGQYRGVSRSSIDDIVRWFGVNFGVQARDTGSFAVTLSEMPYVGRFFATHRRPVSAKSLRPFREIVERELVLTPQERPWVAAGLLRYGQDEFNRYRVCRKRLEMLLNDEVAECLWKEHVKNGAPVDCEAISKRLASAEWSPDFKPMGFELEHILRGYGEHPESPNCRERFEEVEKALR